MGLDMYAYTIKASLVQNMPDTDVNVHQLARLATGFKDMTEDQLTTATDEQRKTYWEDQRDASDQARRDDIANTDFWYWRKFNALHGWMQDLYTDKGGTDTFNCKTVRLTLEDLERLQKAVDDNQLEPRSGFFWGSDTIYPEDIENLKDFIKAAKEAIASGQAVYYDSWW